MSEDDHYVSIDKVTKHFSISTSTVRAWLRRGVIPEEAYIKVGKTTRFNLKLITKALIANNEKEAPEKEPPEPTTIEPIRLYPEPD